MVHAAINITPHLVVLSQLTLSLCTMAGPQDPFKTARVVPRVCLGKILFLGLGTNSSLYTDADASERANCLSVSMVCRHGECVQPDTHRQDKTLPACF